jgi:ankyrin repeat protein
MHALALLSTKGCGANVNQPNGSGSTPLFAAAKNGHLDVVELLIRAGASVLHLNNHANSILQAAVSYGSVEIVELLLAAGGPDLHHKDMDGDTALDIAINLKHTAVEAVLRAHIAQLEAARERG